MRSRKSLLTKLVAAIVDEWGFDEVVAELEVVRHSSRDLPGGTGRQPSKKRAKPNAVEQVERAVHDPEQKEILLQLADRYDRKLFLPSVADVREFLATTGNRPIGLKDRSQGFRILLQSFSRMPIVRLQQLAQTNLHSGPSELGSLSDAIAAAGERLPRVRPSD